MDSGLITVFLDFDGVLNNQKFVAYQHNHVAFTTLALFDPVNIDALNFLCAEIRIERIVISSSWRENRDVAALRNMLSSHGFQRVDLVQDVTPKLGQAYEARVAEIGD